MLDQENVKLKRINEKLLSMLNKYRCAYLMSLDIVAFYEEVIRRRCREGGGKDLLEGQKRRKQLNDTWEEEVVLRKKLKMKLPGKEASFEVTLCGGVGEGVDSARGVCPPLAGGEDCSDERDSSGDTPAEAAVETAVDTPTETPVNTPVDTLNAVPTSATNAPHAAHQPGQGSSNAILHERNKSNYVNLGALDFSAYREDSEGYVKYFEKKKTQLSNDKVSTEAEPNYNNAGRQLHQSEFRKRPLFNQSVYGSKQSVIKASPSRVLPYSHKSIYMDRHPKFQGAKKEDALTNRSVYVSGSGSGTGMSNLLSKHVGVPRKVVKNEPHKGSFIAPSHRPITHLNKSVYVDTKGAHNRGSNLSEGLGGTNKATLLSRDNLKKVSTVSRPSGLQNSVYVKRMNSTIGSGGGGGGPISFSPPHASKGAPNKSVYMRSNTLAIGNKKRKTSEGEESFKCLSANEKVKAEGKVTHLHDGMAAEGEKTSSGDGCIEEENTLDGTLEEEKRKESPNMVAYFHLSYEPLTLKNVELLMGSEIIDGEHSLGGSSLGDDTSSVENAKRGKDYTRGWPPRTEGYSAGGEEPQEGEKRNAGDVPLKKEAVSNLAQKGEEKSSLHLGEVTPVGGDMDSHSGGEKLGIKRASLLGREGSIPPGDRVNGLDKDHPVGGSNMKEDDPDMVRRNKNDHIQPLNHLSGCDQIGRAKRTSSEMPLKFQNIILSINDEIKRKLQGGCSEKGEVSSASKCKEANTSGAKPSFTASVRKNLLPCGENTNAGVEIERSVNNNRANLHIQMSTTVGYVSLDMVDLDKAMYEGLFLFKDVERSFIPSEQNVKDIAMYDEILKGEAKGSSNNTSPHSKINSNQLGLSGTSQRSLFKSSQEVKNEMMGFLGVSIFYSVNVESLFPSVSLVNDEKLSLWFTKRVREKNAHKHALAKSFCRGSNPFGGRIKKRLSCMGYFTQPVTIMLCSLKRQSEFKNLKKIVSAVVLCTCDSTTLEKILHTIPEASSKHFSLWTEALHRLESQLGPKRKRSIIRKLLRAGGGEDARKGDNRENAHLANPRDSDPYGEDSESDDNDEDDDQTGRKNKHDDQFELKTYDFMKGMNTYDGCLSDSFSSKGVEQSDSATHTPVSSSRGTLTREKQNEEHFETYEDEEFCLFICTIPNAHKRFRYLLLIENFNFIYEDLLKHIQNKLITIELIASKHLLLKQLFCNILFLCNWLNEPKTYRWFQWDTVVRKVEMLHGYLENGRISRDRCMLLLLAQHTGEIFSDKELHEMKKVSKFHVKDLYDRSIDFINSFLELRGEMGTAEFARSCCVGEVPAEVEAEVEAEAEEEDAVGNLLKDKFPEKVHQFVEEVYGKMLLIISRLVLLIKQYLALVIWLGDIRPFYPLFSYVDKTRKVKYSQDLFVNLVAFFESYNKYIHMIQKDNEMGKNSERKRHALLDGDTSSCSSRPGFYSPTLDDASLQVGGNLRGTHGLERPGGARRAVDGNAGGRKSDHGGAVNMYGDPFGDSSKALNTEVKKRKSLTNTVDYACEVKRKSVEKERRRRSVRQTSFEKTCEADFELSD
ncbi:nuclear formin-like protein MISFIT, putative [Plasmodium vivax]|uniref:Nuclear formin-like protein MISFIT, putative n=1 Tax=Plasmodium vivax TaxID=5855 RepID=A0A565A3G4_PLAVI|nr:nuclear formin-like protein MISFIT, putative [Plasmodium vivax]